MPSKASQTVTRLFRSAIAQSLTLDLVLAVFELEAQVLRQGACVVQAQGQRQFPFTVQHRAVSIVGILGRDREALVVVLYKGWQEGIGGINVGDCPQTHFLYQAIL